MWKTLAVAFGLFLAAPAAAGTDTLTRHEAQVASKKVAVQSFGTLFTRKMSGYAPIRVVHCSVNGPRGRCLVIVGGTMACQYRSHIVKTPSSYLIWGNEVRCGSTNLGSRQ